MHHRHVLCPYPSHIDTPMWFQLFSSLHRVKACLCNSMQIATLCIIKHLALHFYMDNPWFGQEIPKDIWVLPPSFSSKNNQARMAFVYTQLERSLVIFLG